MLGLEWRKLVVFAPAKGALSWCRVDGTGRYGVAKAAAVGRCGWTVFDVQVCAAVCPRCCLGVMVGRGRRASRFAI